MNTLVVPQENEIQPAVSSAERERKKRELRARSEAERRAPTQTVVRNLAPGPVPIPGILLRANDDIRPARRSLIRKLKR
jgi:hypothetical protein